MKTNELNISENLKRNINKLGYNTLTPIEEQAIPVILENKDVIGIAKTGSGKTLAYSIPLIERCYQENNNPRIIKSLILVPTRELAMQVRNEINSISSDFLRTVVIMGGIAQSKQIHDLKKGVDVLVATPGRLNDLLNQRKISLANVDKIVLDEADTMLDMGFIKDIETILTKTATERQILLFTATMGTTIKDLASKFLVDPVKIIIETPKEMEPLIKEELFFINGKEKNDFLLSYISSHQIKEALIFTRTKMGADKLCNFLNSYDLKSVAIHSDKRQNERSRNLRFFKEKKVNFLIATDIAARGIDIKSLPYVINYNLPDQPELYVHRIGRTGRAGELGTAVSICTPDEKNYLRDIERELKHEIPLLTDDQFSIELVKLEERSHGNSSSRGRGRSFGQKSNNKSNSERKSYGEHKSYGDNKSFGERKSYGKRNSYDENRSSSRGKSFEQGKPYFKTHGRVNKNK